MTFLSPQLIPLGIWDTISGGLSAMMQPIYWAISGILVGFHWLYSQVMDAGSGWTWTLAIVSLTVVIRTAMIPLFVRQITTSRKMQLLGPRIKALQDKHGADRERLGQETMKLYKAENVNPAASCLPILLQMPIFIGLFTVLNNAANGFPTGTFFEREPALVESLRHARVFGAEISGRFLPFADFGATQGVALFLIIAMTASLFFTQLHMMRKNMPPEALEGPMAQQQKMMLYMFPIIYVITGVSIPIGVMIYWLASNLWTLGQQYILVHNSPAPNTPAYVDWEERMLAKGKDPEAVIAKRLGLSQGHKPTETADPTRVVRQGSTRATWATPSAPKPPRAASKRPKGGATKSGAAVPRPVDGVAQRQHIQRQQPSRQTRANRKQAKPKE